MQHLAVTARVSSPIKAMGPSEYGNFTTGEQIAMFRIQRDWLGPTAFSPDLSLIVTCIG